MSGKQLELLSPAKNRESGVAAINHGADAVYIGAKKFSARSAAGNSVGEIEKLAAYAHLYKARVYIALNTLIFDQELEEAQRIIRQLWDAGVDALIIQDLGLLELDLPPVPLFASTQLDNRTVSRVRCLEEAGFERVILARELSLKQIRDIRENTAVDLEVFVHGAICACYSGQCYLSAAIGKRSANRGECGQPCRLAWTLMNGHGQVVEKDRYLLSLKDMNRSGYLHQLVLAGITSFKIEGRLKDVAYVKNITAYYRKQLDSLMAGYPEYRAASSGRTELFFVPDPLKTFNRGQTDYFLSGRKDRIHSLHTPKSMGEPVGLVDHVDARYFTLKKAHDLNNGDGLCFMNGEGKLEGFQVNRVDQGRIYPAGLCNLKKSHFPSGVMIHRNHDHVFLKKLANSSSQRKIALDLNLFETPDGFILQGKDEDGHTAKASLEIEKTPAKNEVNAFATLKKQLSRLGDSLFYLRTLTLPVKPYFMTTKALNQIRREVLNILLLERQNGYVRVPSKPRPAISPLSERHLGFTANVANHKAVEFYQKRGVQTIDPAFELDPPGPGTVVMTLCHCILKALGQCRKEGRTLPENRTDPLYIENKAGRFEIEFDCVNCEMRIRTV